MNATDNKALCHETLRGDAAPAYWTRAEREEWRRQIDRQDPRNVDEASRILATVDALEKALLLCQGALIHGNHNLSTDMEIALGECKRLLAALEAK